VLRFAEQFFLTGAIIAACTAASMWVGIRTGMAEFWEMDFAFGIIIGGCVAWMVAGGVMKNRPRWWPTERLKRRRGMEPNDKREGDR